MCNVGPEGHHVQGLANKAWRRLADEGSYNKIKSWSWIPSYTNYFQNNRIRRPSLKPGRWGEVERQRAEQLITTRMFFYLGIGCL